MARGWTDDQIAALDVLIADEQPLAAIELATGRCKSTIRSRMRLMIGQTFGKVPDRPWSKCDVDDLMRMHSKGLGFIHIGLRLKRNPRHCQAKHFDLNCGKPARAPVRTVASKEVMAQRDARVSLSHQTVTAFIFGDPPPGRSALDMRGRA